MTSSDSNDPTEPFVLAGLITVKLPIGAADAGRAVMPKKVRHNATESNMFSRIFFKAKSLKDIG
jgi:hypothetical protein